MIWGPFGGFAMSCAARFTGSFDGTSLDGSAEANPPGAVVPALRPALTRRAWPVLAFVALLWPAHLSGPLDGIPLDTRADAIVIGVVLPALWWFHAGFLDTRLARTLFVLLLAWKALMAAALVQDGWCVRFEPTRPVVFGATGAPHSWDMRADWRTDNPTCSAIVTRPYEELHDFPMWFFNLPPPNESWPIAADRPPGATVAMRVAGVVTPRRSGVISFVFGPDVSAVVRVDEAIVSRESVGSGVSLTPTAHRIQIDSTLTGDRWRFEPRWNGADLWSSTVATMKRPSRADLLVRGWGRWVTAALVTILSCAWIVFAAARIANADVLTWSVGASCWLGLMMVLGHPAIARWSLLGLLGAAWIPVPARLRNLSGAFILIGVPWLTLIVALTLPEIGRFRLYEFGHDYWMFQRFAYRIVIQGYWLEGGSAEFYFQPFYRWIVGVLHVVFGDSSVGESYWDAACVLVMALFAFYVTKVSAGFRWGLAAAVSTLGVLSLGTTWRFIGLGLADISTTGFAYLAAMVALRSRRGRWRVAVGAGVLAALAFYTRLNTLPMAFGVAVFALSLRQPASSLFRPLTWRRRISWHTPAGVCATLIGSLLFFAWRNWYYNGTFSLFHGTSLTLNAIYRPGMKVSDYLVALGGSVMMQLTMNEPPRFDPYALPILVGAIASVLAIARVPRFRELPLAAVLFFLATISSALVARAPAYPGRFSIPLIGVTSAIAACAAATVLSPIGRRRRNRRVSAQSTCAEASA